MLLGVGVALIVIELGIRFLPIDLPSAVRASVSIHAGRNVVEGHPSLGWSLVPDLRGVPVPSADYELFHVTTHSVGADGTAFRGPKTANPFGVVVGDSFVFGFGVEQEQSLPALLGEQVGEAFANFGVYGYGPQQAGIALRDYALATSPNVAIWVFFENDLNDAHNFEVAPPVPRERGARLEPQDWHNKFWATFKYWRYRSPYLSSRREHYRSGTVELILHYNCFDELDLGREQIQKGLQHTRTAFESFASDCHLAGTLPFVVLMPFKESVYRNEFRELARQKASWEVLDDTRAVVKEAAVAAGLPALDLTPFLRSVRDKQIYQVADAHLSPLGNRLAAEQISTFIRTGWER